MLSADWVEKQIAGINPPSMSKRGQFKGVRTDIGRPANGRINHRMGMAAKEMIVSVRDKLGKMSQGVRKRKMSGSEPAILSAPLEISLIINQPKTCQIIHQTIGSIQQACYYHSMDNNGSIPLVSVVGRSGSGKTTFLTLLTAELKRRGLKVAIIKHSNPLNTNQHELEIDQPGKDTWRHFQSGADAVILAAPNKIGFIQRLSYNPSPSELIGLLLEKPDIVITEGFKQAGLPSIEIVRAARSKELVSDPSHLIGLVTDVENLSPAESVIEIPRFSLTDASGVADLLIHRFSL